MVVRNWVRGVFSRALVLKPECALKAPGGSVKSQIPGPQSRVSDLIGLGLGLRIYISKKFLHGTDAAGWDHTLRVSIRQVETSV